jgi:2-polyprenyl-6-hydroxyphenyl methylase/3-demethylubiquinone-9 3-methyltransferase
MLLDEVTLDRIAEWFGQFGTDVQYLRVHFHRFVKTHEFFAQGSKPREVVLDIGAHWLHNAFFYANDGHELHCVDAPITMRHAYVKKAAEAMGATLHISKYLEFGDGISDLPENSVDTVLMCEIIEHLTFNPIPLWAAIYRVLKPEGRVIVTTPNANYWVKLCAQFRRLTRGEGIGIELEQILSAGTYGHHWKEYTVGELTRYFEMLSPDFHVARATTIQINPVITRPPDHAMPFALGEQMHRDNIFMEVKLRAKDRGIVIKPPWIPQYE